MTDRRGAALPLVLLLVALLGALAALTLLGSRVRSLAGERALDRARATAGAQGTIQQVLGNWPALAADTLPVGIVVGLPTAAAPGIRSTDSIHRLGKTLYLVRSEAERVRADGGTLARAGLGYLLHLVRPALPESAAVVAAGAVTLEGTALASGYDSLPLASWSAGCPPPGAPRAGIQSAGMVADCPGGGCTRGAPPLLTDTAVTTARLGLLGAVTLPSLMAQANHRVGGAIPWPGPALTGGSCDRGSTSNWGDPLPGGGPCAGWFPVISAGAGTVVGGGVGQGVLIGTGTLELSGDLGFTGVVIAVGSLRLRDRVRVTGAVVALDSVTLSDSVIVEWSDCAVTMALGGAARPAERPTRPWVVVP
ncbi:MAG: hypothetical protein SF070_18215 [Gemmatimonadota bacterium]|nr:hypothetical protein [Gemmatimonadota bacterium]